MTTENTQRGRENEREQTRDRSMSEYQLYRSLSFPFSSTLSWRGGRRVGGECSCRFGTPSFYGFTSTPTVIPLLAHSKRSYAAKGKIGLCPSIVVNPLRTYGTDLSMIIPF